MFLVALASAFGAVAVGCSLGGGGEQEEAETRTTGPDAAALRHEWAQKANTACSARNDAIADVMKALPSIVERQGLRAAASRLTRNTQKAVADLGEADPAPGDEGRTTEMVALYKQALTLQAQALAAPYNKRDRRFYARMRKADEGRKQADAIAVDLGATSCAEQAGPYAGIDEVAAIRWGDRASKLCRARDRDFGRLRPTDIAAFDAVSMHWLRQMRTLASPKRYARKIERFLDLYAASVRASMRGSYEESNRLSERSSDLMYDIGFAIGFERFCSARPA
jgi:hypothetical protein